MNNKDEKSPTPSFYPCIILTVIASISFVVINPVFGIIAGVLAWLSYKKTRKETATQQKTSPKAAVNEGTKNLIGTLITEQETQNQKPLEEQSYRIKRGALPVHVHDMLDEMEITTWLQLSLLDEKELLYEKCFGQEALRDLKDELAKRGLSLNNSQTTI
ncbi:MAG: hypothetical protein DRP56_07400 [Planctomycetota bacterium]|nr:MAG: hypothetical protein DRP56_07400 [Planctomycetota bacterium]